MTQPDPDMRDIDALFADAADGHGAEPSPAFMAQVMQDALTHQPVVVPVYFTKSRWRQVMSALGGWQGMGGLVAATCAGFWIGINPPDTLPVSMGALLNLEMVYGEADTDALTGYGWDLEEG